MDKTKEEVEVTSKAALADLETIMAALERDFERRMTIAVYETAKKEGKLN